MNRQTLKIYMGQLGTQDCAQLRESLMRWSSHIGCQLAFINQRSGCDVAILDADQPQYGAFAAGERVIGVGKSRIYGAHAHVSRDFRPFQLAEALSKTLDQRMSLALSA
jgi:hypothetical protein